MHGRQHSSWGKRFWDQYGEQVLCVCENIRAHLIRDFKMPKDRLHVVGNPLEIPAPHSATVTSSAQAHWLWAGRLTGPKGQALLALLKGPLPRLLRENPDLHFTVAGGHPRELGSEGQNVFDNLVREFSGRLLHQGFTENLAEAYTRSSLVIGAGRVALEALTLKIPVLALGEFRSHGLIDEANWAQAVAGNFGDVGLRSADDSRDRDRDLDLTEKALRRALSGEGPPLPERERLAERVRRAFSAHTVARRVEEAYRSAVFLKHHPRPIPILMYHKIVETELRTPHRIFVTKDVFESHLRALKDAGRVALNFQDLLDFKEGRRPWSEFPAKPVILTFDDGYRNNLEFGVPLLKKHGMKAVLFLLADRSLSTNSWDDGSAPQLPLMTPAERAELAASGVFEIGSHGFRHRRITEMSEVEARAELHESKLALEAEFQRPVHAFAFTYGDTSEDAARWAAEEGYRYAINTDSGSLRVEDNPWAVFRTSVFPEDGPERILQKTRPLYRWRYRWTRGK